MIGLTRQQRALLSFIESYLAEHNGVAPSFDEMKDALDLKSKSGAHRVLTGLEERGLICRVHNRSRAIEVVEHDPLAGVPTWKLIAELKRRGASLPVAA